MNEVMLGSLIFRPSKDNNNKTEKQVLFSFWGENSYNTSINTIRMKSKEDITTLYDLLNNTFLNNKNNIYNLTFIELLETFKQGKLKNISELFDNVTQNNEFYSETLEHIKNMAVMALNNQTIDYSNNEIQKYPIISKEEYNTFTNYLQTYFKTLNIIKKSVQLYLDFELFKNAAVKYTNAHNILYNDISLNLYITNAESKNIKNLNIESKLNITPKLNPYIKKYVNLYGWPIDNIFDSELMSKIIINNTTLP